MFGPVPELDLRDVKRWFRSSKHILEDFEGYEDHFWSSGGAESLATLCEDISLSEERVINVYVPAYFCGQSLRFLRSPNIKLYFYPLNEKYLPESSSIISASKINSVDVLVHVHYFGSIQGQEKSRSLADSLGAILIEDCAHIISPFIMNSFVGDYLIFSPHKHFPLPKSSLVISKNKTKLKLRKKKDRFPVLWFLKGLLKLIIRKRTPAKWGRIWSNNSEKLNSLDLNDFVKNLATNYLLDYKIFTEKRTNNQTKIAKILSNFENWKPILAKEQIEAPYLLGMICDSEEIARKRFNFLNRRSQIVMQWPDLPIEIKDTDFQDQSCKLVDRTLFFFSHQKIEVDFMLKDLRDNKIKKNLDNYVQK